MSRASIWIPVAVCGVMLFARGAASDAARDADDDPSALADRASLRVDPGHHTAAATSIAASGDGASIVTGSEDRTIRVWDARSGELLRTLRPPSSAEGDEGRIYSVALSPDGRWLAAGGITRFFDERTGHGSAVYLFDAASGALVRRFRGPLEDMRITRIERIVFSADGKRLAARRNTARTLTLYDFASGAPDDETLPQSGMMYRDLDFDSAGSLLLSRPEAIALYDGARRRVAEIDRLPRTFGARFLSDGKQIVVIYDSGQVELRRRPGGKAAAPIPLGTDLPALSSLKAVTVAADGQSLFIAAELSQNGRAVIRCLPFNSKIAGRDIELPQIFATSLAALPAGGVAFAGSDGSWGVWEVPGTLRRHGVSRMWSAPPDALRVDQTGDEIEVRLGPRGAERLRFSVSALELRPATTGSKLRPPAVEAKAPHSITGWQHNPPVLWNGAAILGRQYDPAALAISPAKDAFVIGSNQTLSGFRFERSETDGCPRPPAPKDHVPAPCFALFVPSPVRSLNYSGDGRYALALLSDGTVHWYDARDGSEKLALVLRPSDARWLLFRPDGLFAASPGGAELGGYQVNDTTEERAPDFFPLSRVKKRFERPEEIAATLSGAAEKSGPLSANWPPSSLLRSELPPLLTILEPADGAMVSSPLVTVKIAMRSLSDRPTTALRARIDGRPISIAQPRGIVDMAVKADTPRPAPVHNPPTRPGSTPSDGTVSINLTIPERDCVVALFAESDVGAGPPALLRLRFRSAAGQTPAPQQGALTNAAPQPRGSLRVLAIGVDDYKQAELRLRYPGKDARDLAALIEKLHGKNGAGLYQSVDMRVLTGREATKAAILESLDWLQHRATSADTTLLFLAGHGINDAATGDYFFLPVDADLASAMRTMLPASTLRQVLANVQGRIVLMLDTCHSGNILGRAGRKLRGLPPLSRAIAELSSVDSGIVVMAAATGDQASIEDTAWQNGAFAKAILEGLGGRADLRHTGRVTVNMLDLYVSERVRELTDGSQTPATAKPSTIADFPIVLSQP